MVTTDSLPPGIQGNLKHANSGGRDVEWMPFEKRKYYTNVFLVQNGKILLGYKKRGFGKHKYNGFGGKVEDGETPLQAAVRELEEEAGITAPLKHAGSLIFFSEGANHAFHIEIYRAEEYSGDIMETDEMRPQWFSTSSGGQNETTPPIPLEQMWDSDSFWMPLFLDKKIFVGRTDFKREGEIFTLQKWWFGVASES